MAGFKATRRNQNDPKVVLKIKIRKNDTVKVIAGRDKGKTGRVLDVNRETGRALVEGVNMIKRHTRPNPAKQIKGGIAERESTIDVSNLMLMTAGGVATRVGYKTEGEGASARRVRIARKTGEVLDKSK
jgi:large subunit ribosomal protein L24